MPMGLRSIDANHPENLLQTGVQDMEEKVQYQSEERLRDIQVGQAKSNRNLSVMLPF